MRHLALITLLALTPLAHAAGVDCKNATTQTDMNICANQDFKRSDALLNQAYKLKMSQLNLDQQKKLKLAQRNWIAFRDSDCDLQSSGVPVAHCSRWCMRSACRPKPNNAPLS